MALSEKEIADCDLVFVFWGWGAALFRV